MLSFRKILFNIFVVLGLSSCATIFNSKVTDIQIISNRPCEITIESDQAAIITSSPTKTLVAAARRKAPLIISLATDSLTKTIEIKPRSSLMFWMNLYPFYGAGFVVDWKTPKRYTYPKHVYVDMLTTNPTYTKSIPVAGLVTQYNNVFKVTPLKLIGLTNPSFEASYERKFSPAFSVQIMGSYLIANGILTNQTKASVGTRMALEAKYYFQNSAPAGYYVAFELDYLDKNYERKWTFVDPELDHGDSLYYENNYVDTFNVYQNRMGYSLKVGYQFIKTNRFALDIYGGLGFAVREIKHTNRNNPNDVPVYPIDLTFGLGDLSEGKMVVGMLPLNLRIGWVF